MTEKLKFVLGRVEKPFWEKEKMLVTSIFTFCQNVFKKPLSHGCLKVGNVWQRVHNALQIFLKIEEVKMTYSLASFNRLPLSNVPSAAVRLLPELSTNTAA